MAAIVRIKFDQFVPLDATEAYALLCDWEDHGRWVPLTKVTVHDEASFTAFTGVGPLVLKDEMVVFSKDDAELVVVIRKTGPILTGTAGFAVRPFSQGSCVVTWEESLRVPLVPWFLAPVLRVVTRALFRAALKNLPPS